MNRRQAKKEATQRRLPGRQMELLLALQDAHDTIEAVHRALDEGDGDEARRLLLLGEESLAANIDELREKL